eukprot:gene231-434_t
MDPGLKGCQFLLGTLPTWITLTEREKMEEVVEPIFDAFKPPLFKKIFFRELTFGEAPVRVEGTQQAVNDSDYDMSLPATFNALVTMWDK